MKKEYVAPDLYFESFELSEGVAAGCDSTGITTMEQYMANYLFTDDIPSNYLNYTCQFYATGIVEDYCYYAGSNNTLLLS